MQQKRERERVRKLTCERRQSNQWRRWRKLKIPIRRTSVVCSTNFLINSLFVMTQSQYQVDPEYLDAEFNVYLKFARHLIGQMSSREDRNVAEKYIKNCITMKHSDQAKAKFHRNRFFRYLLKTMRKTVDSPAPAVFINKSDLLSATSGSQQTSENEFRQWSANRKSYVSAKIVPGVGTLIYMACTDHPECGWTENGFANFSNDISDVPNPSAKNDEWQEIQFKLKTCSGIKTSKLFHSFRQF